jgi:hypothetical protein
MDAFSVVTAGRAPSFSRLICGGNRGSERSRGERRRGKNSPIDKSLKRPAREAWNGRNGVHARRSASLEERRPSDASRIKPVRKNVGEMEERAKPNFVFPFEKLEVWQLSVDLADFVLNLLESLPPNKYIRVTGQAEAKEKELISSSRSCFCLKRSAPLMPLKRHAPQAPSGALGAICYPFSWIPPF